MKKNISLDAKIYVAGHNGLVGSAIVRVLQKQGYKNLLTRSHAELDLINQAAVNDFFEKNKPDYVYIAAGKVGGIHANNTYPAEFIYQNLMIETNIVAAAHQNNVKRLLCLGSSCIYPKFAEQPMTEDALLSSILEPTNEPYAIAKIAGIKLCESYNRQYGTDYRSVMPTNLYGPGDNYDMNNGHVIPSLMLRFHNAKIENKPSVEVWGTGNAKREFLYIEDMANACVFVLNLQYEDYMSQTTEMTSHLNIGTGEDISIREVAEIVKDVVGFKGKLKFDTSKPDGTPRKLLDVNRINNLGWYAKTKLYDGLKVTYKKFLELN
jgi:GDP-L-fucose synthase